MKRDLPPGGPAADPRLEVQAEIEHYLEERAKELIAEGMDPDAARVEASRAFGDIERIEAEVQRIRRGRERDEGRNRLMGTIAQDLKMALRGLRSRPGFAAVVTLTLALGIGAVTALYSVTDAALLEALPFDEADRLVFIQGAYDAPEGPQVRGASVPEFQDWTTAASFTGMTPVWTRSVNLTGTDGPASRIQAEQVGDGYFRLLRVTPVLGRTFTPEETVLSDGAHVAILSESLWADRFGRSSDVLGNSITLNGASFTIIGVLPQTFPGTGLQSDLWLPIGNGTVGIATDLADSRGSRWLTVLARLTDGVTVDGAQDEMNTLAERLEAAYPEDHEDRIALVTPMRDVYLGETRTLVLLVLSASALLLAIAGANVANLLLVRTTGRSGEVLVKKALGAGKKRLASQFLTESMVLAGLGALLGLAVGAWGAQALAGAMPQALLPSYVNVSLDPEVFLVAAGLMTLVGLLSGLAPAFLAARSDVASGLREGNQGGLGRARTRLQRVIVAGEIALALLLMVGAGLMTRSFQAQLAVNPGFDHEELYAFRVTFPAEPYSGETLRAAAQEIQDRLGATPGVTEVTRGDGAPLRGGFTAGYLFTEGSSAEDRIRFYIHRVAPGWFETLGTKLERGRALNAADLDNPEVTVISQALASRFFPDQNPIGQSIRLGRPDGLQLQIVGVAEDVRFRDLTSDLGAGADDPDIYVPWQAFASRAVDFVMRTAVDPATLERTAREVVASFDPGLPVFLAYPMAESLGNQTAQARFGTLLLGVFSAMALLLALVGLYGVLSFTVDQRRREIALRMAVGAEAGNVRRMVVGQGLRLAGLGMVLGLVAAALSSRTLSTFLYGVEPTDLRTYVTVAGLMTIVAAAATWLPAVRATRVDPQGALKAE